MHMQGMLLMRMWCSAATCAIAEHVHSPADMHTACRACLAAAISHTTHKRLQSMHLAWCMLVHEREEHKVTL